MYSRRWVAESALEGGIELVVINEVVKASEGRLDFAFGVLGVRVVDVLEGTAQKLVVGEAPWGGLAASVADPCQGEAELLLGRV